MTDTDQCTTLSRRDWVRAGCLSALGLGLLDHFDLPTADANAASFSKRINPKAKACILIWLDGGPTHLETFDPKPNAPDEVRGPMGTTSTALSGVRINECFQNTSKLMNKLAIIRSMTSPLGEHNFGTHYLMTGYKPSPALNYPAYGATLAHVRKQVGVLPPNIAIPKFTRNISGSGYLARSTGPFSLGGDPARGNFKVQNLDFHEGLNLDRIGRRRDFSDAIDQFSRKLDASRWSPNNPNLERAYNLIASPQAKKAFDLSDEPQKIRQRYGFGNTIGQSCLLARRLVQSGVPFVTVNSTGWDTHQDLSQLKSRFPNDKNALLPALDRGFSALITDLSENGMLDETLVVVMGEFGRTPKINVAGGRDHWPNVFSVLLTGGGIQGGQIVGRSDALGEYPQDNPVTPADLATTIYSLLGVDPATQLPTGDGRTVRVASEEAKILSDLVS